MIDKLVLFSFIGLPTFTYAQGTSQRPPSPLPPPQSQIIKEDHLNDRDRIITLRKIALRPSRNPPQTIPETHTPSEPDQIELLKTTNFMVRATIYDEVTTHSRQTKL